MHEYGQATVIRFLPSEKLQESVSSLLHLWEEFIGDMSTRWGRIVSIQVTQSFVVTQYVNVHFIMSLCSCYGNSMSLA